ncbi:hypothetical protein C4K03_3704 [Pseudomonas synxantha]|uniref:Uncharacterized protein n=1 Tax=Pseudomonas synxantha TaxID=47883 RepID=A0A3G7U941_9PSED|nr:hypothetical protein C4K03_3704 [Pseudomonas synxantha]
MEHFFVFLIKMKLQISSHRSLINLCATIRDHGERRLNAHNP